MEEQFFSTEFAGWQLEQGAQITANEENQTVLELFAPADGPVARAVSEAVRVEASAKYRISYTVHGVPGFGDAATTHYFRVYPIDKEGNQIIGLQGQRFAGTPNFLDCMSFYHVKYLSFQVPEGHETVRFAVEAKGPAKVQLHNFKLELAVEKRNIGEIQLDMPFNYRDGVFHTNPAEKITGKVVFFAPEAASCILSLTDYECGIKEFKYMKADEDKRFELPVPEMGKSFELTLKVFNAENKEIYSEVKPIRHYPPNPVEVTFRDDGVTLLNGKPFFQIGHWWFTNRGDRDEDIEFLKEAGFNVFLLPRDDPYRFSLLKIAEKHKILSVIELPTAFEGNTPEEKEAERKKWCDLIVQHRDHPYFFGYFAPDEAMWRGVQIEPMEEVYQDIRKLDPYHPSWYNESPCGTMEAKREYATRICDVFGVDIYPLGANRGDMVEDRTMTAVGKHTDRCMQAVEFRRPVWMILQGFAWKHFQAPGLPADQIPGIYYPSWEESRFMAFNAICHGATGIQYHWLGYTLHVPDEFWKGLRRVTLELTYLTPVLTARMVDGHGVVCNEEKIRFIVKDFEGKRYYIAINESPEAVKAVFTGMNEDKLNVIYENEPLKVVDSQVTVDFAPYAVKVMSAAEFSPAEKIWKSDSYRPYSARIKDDKRKW